MARYTKKDVDGRCYIEGANGKLESNIKGHTYGEAIERFAELENADVTSRVEVATEVLDHVIFTIDNVLSALSFRVNAKGGRTQGKTIASAKMETLLELKSTLTAYKINYIKYSRKQ